VLYTYATAAKMQSRNGKSTSIPGHISSTVGDSKHRGASALESIGLDGDCPESIRELVPDEYLIQLGDILDESPCSEALDSLKIDRAYGSDQSLFGVYEGKTPFQWEHVTSQSKSGLAIEASRALLRKGLYIYKSRVYIEGLEPHDVRPFHLDDQARSLWDQSAILVERELPAGSVRLSRHAESCLHRYISRFPRPLSPRTYEYARRVWTRPSDGGCYAISKSCDLPTKGPQKYVQVKEYISGCIIRGADGGTEILTAYFEDSQVRAGLAKMAVPKGLWPFWTKYEISLRLFSKAKQVNIGRRSIDLASGSPQKHSARRPIHDDDESSEYDSDDEVYDALARLKAKKTKTNQGTSRWARRIMIAGAIKMIHEAISSK